MLFWIFLVRCSLRSTVIFLLVSKKIQKYDHRKFYFFSEKQNFRIRYSRSSLKKKSQKKFTIFFSVHQNCTTKKIEISKISNKKFRKIHYFANIKYKRNLRKYCKKNLLRNIFVKREIFAKKNSMKIFAEKKIGRKIFSYKKFFEKKNSKKILEIILAIFLYLKKNSVKLRKKNRKKI